MAKTLDADSLVMNCLTSSIRCALLEKTMRDVRRPMSCPIE